MMFILISKSCISALSHSYVLVFLFKMHWRFFLHFPPVYLYIKANTVGSGRIHTPLCISVSENVQSKSIFLFFTLILRLYLSVPWGLNGIFDRQVCCRWPEYLCPYANLVFLCQHFSKHFEFLFLCIIWTYWKSISEIIPRGVITFWTHSVCLGYSVQEGSRYEHGRMQKHTQKPQNTVILTNIVHSSHLAASVRLQWSRLEGKS